MDGFSISTSFLTYLRLKNGLSSLPKDLISRESQSKGIYCHLQIFINIRKWKTDHILFSLKSVHFLKV